jgi:hypothetical protein
MQLVLAERLKDLQELPVWEALLEYLDQREEACLLRLSPSDSVEVNAMRAMLNSGKLQEISAFRDIPAAAKKEVEARRKNG